MKIEIRKPLDYDAAKASLISSVVFTKPTRTQQHFRDEVDINFIVKNFLRTGQLPVMSAQGIYGDFLNAPDSFHDAKQRLIDAEDAFLDLPSDIRARFKNDPGVLLEFLQDPKNHDEGVTLGLFKKPLEELKTHHAGTLNPPSPAGEGSPAT